MSDKPGIDDPDWKSDPSLLPDLPPDRLASSAYIDSAMRRARTDINQWLSQERSQYADIKWNADNHDQLIRNLRDDPHQESDGRQYIEWVNDYIQRALLFGLDTPQGRQALGKTCVTLHHMLESCVVAFGPMPKPGVPSGEIQTGEIQ